MSKVHITLVGGQPMPVYLGIKHCNPEKLVFIYSKESEAQMNSIREEVPNIPVIESKPLDPVKFKEIENVVLKYKDLFSSDEVTINISSGTKAWAYYFIKIFGETNAHIIYVDQNNEVYDFIDNTHTKVNFNLQIQFRLNRNPLQSYTDFKVFKEKDFEALAEIEKARNLNIGDFTSITNINSEKRKEIESQPSGFINKGSAKLSWKKGVFTYSVIKKGEEHVFTFSSPNIMKILFNASWFELKVAKIISSWEKVNAIYLNCKFLVNNQNSSKMIAEQYPKNEVDIIVDTGDKALFVECKTAIAESTDIEKFNTVVKNYGGHGSKALFVCLSDFGPKEKEKIDDCNMLSYSFKSSSSPDDLVSLLKQNIRDINI